MIRWEGIGLDTCTLSWGAIPHAGSWETEDS